jgi:hypothetical protein
MAFARLAISDTRELSRAELEYPEILMNPIVPRIASMVITTISSTRVNHLYFLILGIFRDIPSSFP